MPRGRHKIRLTAIAGFLLLLAMSAVTGDQDDAIYRLHVPPFMQIRAFRPASSANHPGTAANLTFRNEQWFARSSSDVGVTVTLTTDHAFWHTTDSSFKRDARLSLTRLVGTNGAGWHFVTATDQTNYAVGDETAAVQIASRRPGTVIMWLDVTFLTGSLATLKGGDYEMTVVGTISEN